MEQEDNISEWGEANYLEGRFKLVELNDETEEEENYSDDETRTLQGFHLVSNEHVLVKYPNQFGRTFGSQCESLEDPQVDTDEYEKLDWNGSQVENAPISTEMVVTSHELTHRKLKKVAHGNFTKELEAIRLVTDVTKFPDAETIRDGVVFLMLVVFIFLTTLNPAWYEMCQVTWTLGYCIRLREMTTAFSDKQSQRMAAYSRSSNLRSFKRKSLHRRKK